MLPLILLDFINFHGIDTSEILDPLESFGNFNEFFFRKLKEGARPIAQPTIPVLIER